MSEIRDRVKKVVIEQIASFDLEGINNDFYEETAEKILSIPELAIVDRKAELPNIYECGDEYCQPMCHKNEQENMLKKGWVKEIK